MGDTTEVDHTAKASTIDATTIDAAPPTADWDATDTADATTNLNAETASVEDRGTAQEKKSWKKNSDDKKD